MGIFRAKRQGPDATSVPAEQLVDPEMVAFFPVLWEYLATTVYDDGQVRQTATILFFVEDDRVKACLNDRENERMAWISGVSVRETLEALEGSLVAGHVEWRRKAGAYAGKPARKS